MAYENIYRQAIEKWGEHAQSDQAIEECAELIATLKHYRRGKVPSQSVINELADVILMIGQLVYMFGEDKVTAAIGCKISKLENLLKE
ncbi:MAG: antitoxin [Deltaproteobacteria bacterium]|nr:antitoxin [Deltaproteobacteria bacterium]